MSLGTLLVLAHHGVLATLVALTFGFVLWQVQKGVARHTRADLAPPRRSAIREGALATFLAAVLACAIYVFSDSVRRSVPIQGLLVTMAAAVPLVMAWRAFDKRFVWLPLALLALVACGIGLILAPHASNLWGFLSCAGVGFVALPRYPVAPRLRSLAKSLRKWLSTFRPKPREPRTSAPAVHAEPPAVRRGEEYKTRRPYPGRSAPKPPEDPLNPS